MYKFKQFQVPCPVFFKYYNIKKNNEEIHGERSQEKKNQDKLNFVCYRCINIYNYVMHVVHIKYIPYSTYELNDLKKETIIKKKKK